MGMKLNVLGTKLLPLDDGRMADENLPICAEMGGIFAKWLQSTGDLHAVSPPDAFGRTLLSAETWIQSYQDNSHPTLIAELSHERSLYWLPLDMFSRVSGDTTGTLTNGDEVWQAS